MEHPIDKQPRSATVLRWTARVWSIASVGLLLGFIVGEGINPSGPGEWLGLLFFPIGISIGMILAWWKESLGATITVGSLVAFYLVHVTTSGAFPKGWAWLAFAAPGFLYLIDVAFRRKAFGGHE